MCGTYSTITTLHEGADYRLQTTVIRMREPIDNREIVSAQWIMGLSSFPNAISKRNIQIFRKLNYLMESGVLPEHSLFCKNPYFLKTNHDQFSAKQDACPPSGS